MRVSTNIHNLFLEIKFFEELWYHHGFDEDFASCGFFRDMIRTWVFGLEIITTGKTYQTSFEDFGGNLPQILKKWYPI